MIERNVVVIADRLQNEEHLSPDRTDYEMVEADYFEEVTASLARIAASHVHFESPTHFLDRIGEYRNDVVLSLWSGQRSWNRKALVPAICEAYGMPYVGADAYTHILSADKWLAKHYAARFGLQGSRGWLIDRPSALADIDDLHFPVVLKPNFEGASIGIAQENLVQTIGDAVRVAEKLFRIVRPPILVEEFISGREISIVLVETTGELFCGTVELVLPQQDIGNTLWSYEPKHSGAYVWRPVTNFPSVILSRAISLFKALPKVSVMRVDGRLNDSTFTVIELSPDAHLGTAGGVAAAFINAGKTYDDLLHTLLSNALYRHHDGG